MRWLRHKHRTISPVILRLNLVFGFAFLVVGWCSFLLAIVILHGIG